MTRVAYVRQNITKEIRALLPVMLVCLAVVAVGAVIPRPSVLAAGAWAYVLGCLILGAQSMGHEYAHQTIWLMLSQPVDRRRVYAIKLVVLTAMLTCLTLLGAYALSEGEAAGWIQRRSDRTLLLLPPLGALFLTPLLTMLSRKALAGVLFTIVTPGIVWLSGDLVGVAVYGLERAADVDQFRLALFWPVMLSIFAVGAALSWRMFMHLEIVDGRGLEIQMPRWARDRSKAKDDVGVASRKRAHHPMWMLTRKELHIQQLTFVIVGLYVLGWATVTLVQRYVRDSDVGVFAVPQIALLYMGVLSILIGSLASAEERQLGTLEWQLLLPVASWQQWAVKAGVALGLALLLGVGLPATLERLSRSDTFRLPADTWQAAAIAVVLLTTGSLYVSSLCTGGVRAMVVSVPVIVAIPIVIQVVTGVVWRILFYGLGLTVQFTVGLAVPIFVGVALLALRFALVNHRSADRTVARVLRQGFWMLGYVMLVVVLAIFV